MGFIGGLLREGSEERLSKRAIDAVVKEFAVSKWSPRLTWKSHSFSSAKGESTRRPGGFHVKWNDVAAMFVPPNVIEINADSNLDIRTQVMTILHEIQHYNQEISWVNSDAFKDGFVKGRKKPPAVKDDPMHLYSLELWDLIQFWERRYGYDDAPHEVDAWDFARANIDRAMAIVDGESKRRKAPALSKKKSLM